jgi:hypothetical protein
LTAWHAWILRRPGDAKPRKTQCARFISRAWNGTDIAGVSTLCSKQSIDPILPMYIPLFLVPSQTNRHVIRCNNWSPSAGGGCKANCDRVVVRFSGPRFAMGASSFADARITCARFVAARLRFPQAALQLERPLVRLAPSLQRCAETTLEVPQQLL